MVKGDNMAFNKKNEQITKSLRETLKDVNRSLTDETFERTKQYQFTLQPSVREKIDKLSKEKGYRSASSFINDFFKNL